MYRVNIPSTSDFVSAHSLQDVLLYILIVLALIGMIYFVVAFDVVKIFSGLISARLKTE